MSWSAFTIICLIAVAIAVGEEAARRRRIAPVFARSCAGREWKRAFPDAPSTEIRAFLDLFTEAFALNSKHNLVFRPSDHIMDIYRTIYPPKHACADSLELETFEVLLHDRYGLAPLGDKWRDDITLGEFFRRTRGAAD